MAIKICLDAGHYGKYNRSPVLPSYWESEVMWELHLELKKELEKYGFEVVTTREKQTKNMEVYERGKAAKGCDLFLSLHSNAADAESVDRVTVYRAFDNRNNAEDLASKLAAAIAEVMEVSKGTVATRESKEYPGSEYYGVMRGARKVGVPLYYILEQGFHTNLYCAKWLSDEKNRKRLAKVEAQVIAGYYGLELPEPIPGDVNGDGKLNEKDYLLVKAAVLGNIVLGDEEFAAADVNHDGKVNALDYTMIRSAVLGKLTLAEKKL